MGLVSQRHRWALRLHLHARMRTCNKQIVWAYYSVQKSKKSVKKSYHVDPSTDDVATYVARWAASNAAVDHLAVNLDPLDRSYAADVGVDPVVDRADFAEAYAVPVAAYYVDQAVVGAVLVMDGPIAVAHAVEAVHAADRAVLVHERPDYRGYAVTAMGRGFAPVAPSGSALEVAASGYSAAMVMPSSSKPFSVFYPQLVDYYTRFKKKLPKTAANRSQNGFHTVFHFFVVFNKA